MTKNLIISFLISLSVLVGGRFLFYRNKISAPKDVQKHVDLFLQKKEQNNAEVETFYGLNIIFSNNIPYPIAGISLGSWSDSDKLILLNRFVWEYLTDKERTELVAHELGHAVLHRAHTEAVLIDNTPASIMFPAIFPDSMFAEKEQYYWKELFSVKDDLPKM